MIGELQAAAELCESINVDVDTMRPVWTSLGFTDSKREEYYEKTMAAIRAGHEARS
jgi:hypothetical protein